MDSVTEIDTVPPPPTTPKTAKKTRTARLPQEAVNSTGTSVPPAAPDPSAIPYLDLGTTLAEASAAASRAVCESESYTPTTPAESIVADAPEPAPVQVVRPLEAIADDFKAASDGSLWRRAELAAEAVATHAESSLVRLAVLVNVPRTRLVEDATLGRYFKDHANRCDGASASAHLYGIRLAKRRSKPDATDDHLRSLARIILMQTPDCVKIQALIRAEKGVRVVPIIEPEMTPSAPVAQPPLSGVERALASIREVRDFIEGGVADDDFARVVTSMEEVLAWAKSPKLTSFQPTDATATSAA